MIVEINGNPGNPTPKDSGKGNGNGKLFSLDTLFMVLVALGTILVINRVEPLRRIVKPKP